VRSARVWRIVVAALAAAVLSACSGGGSPTAPEMPPVAIATGPQILRITFQGPCSPSDGRPFVPIIITRVNVTRSGVEWIATAATPQSGTVELRFHLNGLSALGGSAPVAGTIAGTAIHNTDLLPAVPASNTRASFGTDAPTALSGFAFSPSSLTPVPGVSGIGTGAIVIRDDDGHSCNGSAFSWGLGPQA
jgi:hypothetical protein